MKFVLGPGSYPESTSLGIYTHSHIQKNPKSEALPVPSVLGQGYTTRTGHWRVSVEIRCHSPENLSKANAAPTEVLGLVGTFVRVWWEKKEGGPVAGGQLT